MPVGAIPRAAKVGGATVLGLSKDFSSINHSTGRGTRIPVWISGKRRPPPLRTLPSKGANPRAISRRARKAKAGVTYIYSEPLLSLTLTMFGQALSSRAKNPFSFPSCKPKIEQVYCARAVNSR